MTPLARALCLLAVAAGLVWAGYRWGADTRQAAWDAERAAQARAQRDAVVAEAKRGDKAVAAAEADKLTLKEAYDQLDARYAAIRIGAPLTVPAAPGRVARAGPVAACNGAAPAAIGDPAAPLQSETEPGPPVFLTAGAVRMWNGYLAGADRPAGACGLAGGATDADPACAESSGLTVADAFANHAVNARLCAEDRAAHQRLIDFINQGPTE